MPVPEDAFDPKRRQYSSPLLLQSVLRGLPQNRVRALALTSCDLFIPMLTFLYGQAQLGGRAALVSAARLDPQFYGLPADQKLLRARLRKETLHELGHTFGLVHCAERNCVMSLANSILQVDVKDEAFCRSCRGLIHETAARESLEGVS